MAILYSNDIGIDLGTANILVYLKGVGIVIDEPSVVAINKKTERVIAVGFAAKEMLGRTPDHIYVSGPIVDGVISDFELAGEVYLHYITVSFSCLWYRFFYEKFCEAKFLSKLKIWFISI